MITFLLFLVILSVLVFIHELGHFLVARKFGIKVEEFGFGLPPRLWGRKIGETIYSVNWLPIGGFVKLYGEDEAGGGIVEVKSVKLKVKSYDLKRAFFAKPAWQRALVVVAGVVMNTLLAALIYYVFLGVSNFKTELPLLTEHRFFGVQQENKTNIVVGSVAKDSPAEKAGLASGTRIVEINGKKLTDPKQLSETIKQSQGKEITLTWQDLLSSELKTAKVTPRKNPPKNQGAVGVSFFPVTSAVLVYQTPLQKFTSGFVHPLNVMVYNMKIFSRLIAISVKERTAEPIGGAVTGPVGILKVLGDFVSIPDAKERFLQILNLAGLLSISLAFFNVLPIPALDGGRLFFILIEAVTKRKLNPQTEALIHTIGMAVLITLIVGVAAKDFFQFFR